MLISVLEKVNTFNEYIFSPLDNFILSFSFEDWVAEAIIDSLHMLPLLFFIFVVIELLEFFFSDKIDLYIKKAHKTGVLIGTFAAILPQCGFSVIASSLYCRKLITRGCLIAVYLATSDETIPILLANPQKAYWIIPIVGIKLFIAIIMGYFIDIASGIIHDEPEDEEIENKNVEIHEEGCCNHNPETANKRELILYPIMHTLNIFVFILVVTLILNYALEHIPIAQALVKSSHKYLQCVAAAVIGLIPNCAVSIVITMMLIKGSITFGAAMSGLLANAGLGLLVLLRNNNFKDTLKIISILLAISIVSGISIEFLD